MLEYNIPTQSAETGLNTLENALQQLAVETFEIEEIADTQQHAAGCCSSTCSSTCSKISD